MDNLAHSEIFALTLVIGTYLTSLALYKKVHNSLLHPLLTTIFVIIVVLEVLPAKQSFDPFYAGAFRSGPWLCVI